MSKGVTVFDVTGFVGSSVARTLSANGWSVRGVLSGTNGPKASALEDEGIRIIKADLGDKSSIVQALAGATACFVQTVSDLSNQCGHRAEVDQGKLIADACVEANVRHVVYSTQLSVVKVIGVNARHMDAKAEVELYMRHIGLPMTSLIVPQFHYERLLFPPFRPVRKAGCYEIGIPMGYTPLYMMSTEDVGPVVQHIISNPMAHIDKTISVCGDKLTMKEIAGVFTKVLRPEVFKDKQITVEQFRSVDEDMATMFHFFCRVDQRANIDMTRKIHPRTQTLEQWLTANIDVAMSALCQNDSPASISYSGL